MKDWSRRHGLFVLLLTHEYGNAWMVGVYSSVWSCRVSHQSMPTSCVLLETFSVGYLRLGLTRESLPDGTCALLPSIVTCITVLQLELCYS
jgi:hypothetical protein